MGRQSSSKLMSRSLETSEIVSIGSGTYNELTPSSDDLYIKSLYKPSSPAFEIADVSTYNSNPAYEHVSTTENAPPIANVPNPRIAIIAENDAQNLEVEPFKFSSNKIVSPSELTNSRKSLWLLYGLMVIMALIVLRYIGYKLYKALSKVRP